MRLRRLDLVRYGKFTGASVDFGEAPGDGPDLHVVYGPNEAGKSTALNAWLDLLYGIEMKSAYGFLHAYDTMQVGAEIEAGGRVLTLTRTKGNKNTLRDGAGQPMADDLPKSLLGGLDRRALREMFSLDDDTMKEGGNSILDGEGEVGQLLFASGAGLAGFAPALAALRKAPDPFLRGASPKAWLTEAKAELKGIEDRRKAVDTDASGYARLVKARDAAQVVQEAAQKASDVSVAASQVVQRQLAALPGRQALALAQAALDALPDLPPPPPGWSEALATLDRDRTAGAATLAGLEGVLAGLQDERARLVPDPGVLALRDRIAAAAALRSGHDEGAKDLPARRAETAALAVRIGVALDCLGQGGADPRDVLPGPAVVAEVRWLIEGWSGIAADLDRARAELAGAGADLAALGPAEAGAGGDTAPLAHLLRRLQDEAPAATLARATEALDGARAECDRWLRALRPWQGTGQDLLALVVPTPRRIADWKANAAQLAQDGALAEGELRRLDDALAQAVLPQATGGVTLDAAALARAQREAAWATHRAVLDGDSADAFEAAMRRDDAVTARLAETLAEARRRAEAEVAYLGLQQQRALATTRVAAVIAQERDLQDAIAATLAACGLPPMTPDAVTAWNALRDRAVEAWEAATLADLAAGRARAAVQAAQGDLVAALALSGVAATAGEGLAVLLARAGAVVEAAASRAAVNAARRKAVQQVEARQAVLMQAEAAMERWQARWTAALAAAGLPPTASLDAARAALGTLDTLASDVAKHADLAYRVGEMEANVAAYARAVAALAADLGMPPDASARLGDAIAARAQSAEATAGRIADLDVKIARTQDQADRQRRDLDTLDGRLATMVAGFDAEDAADLARRLAQARDRQSALAEVARAGEALRQVMEAPTAEAALAALAGLDRDALTAQALRLKDEVALRSEDEKTAFAALKDAERQLAAVGGDDAVLRLAEARETLLLEVADGARAHLVRKLGLIAVDHALRRYRDTHRSAMIEAASLAFRTMTRGAYAGLSTQPDGTREVLVAQAAVGGSKRADDLSKGTRFQLYLALRVAAYHERAAQGAVPPFVADDIMETFDDDRSAEAFTVMAGMAAKGQVIYLTHHRHLCDIARQVCPQVRLHVLGRKA